MSKPTIYLFEDFSLPVRGGHVKSTEDNDDVWHVSPEFMALLRQWQVGEIKFEETE